MIQQTIGNIYKKKESSLPNTKDPLQKSTIRHNLLIGAHQDNAHIEQTLLEWFFLKTRGGNYICENVFSQKVCEILNLVGSDSIGIDDWIKEFQRKHKITKFSADIKCNLLTKNEWVRFLSDFNSSDVYVGGMFALAHSLNTKGYLNGQSSKDQVSIMFAVNSSGTIKQQLAVISKDTLDKNIIKSIPIKFYPCNSDTPEIDYSILNDYLENWDRGLSEMGKNILLIVNLPDSLLHKFKFENIKLLATRNFDYVTHVLEKIIECFKFHYRRLQNINVTGSEDCLLLDYINMFAMAWHCVPSKYIELLCSPQADGCLYFDINNESYGDHSLSHWYKIQNIPLSLEQCSDLDKFIYCDSKLPCVNWRIEDVPRPSTNTVCTSSDKSFESSSSLEAYQAIKRLVSYLHEQNAGPLLKHAKYLEKITECRALIQMHVISTKLSD